MAATSSAPSALPCACAVSVYFGDGYPMWLRRITRLGRSASAMPSRMPASIASRSLATSPSSHDVPAVAGEPLRDVVGVRELGGAVDGDVVVVVHVDDPAEAEVARERRRLVAHALFEAAVAADREHVVVDDLGAEARPQVRLRERDADAVGEALARAGRW